jgi:transcriptional regulator with XRE-family HTH domain
MPRQRRAAVPLPPLPPAGMPPHRRFWSLRRERRLSITQLAALAGVRTGTICEFERGLTRMPHQRTLAKLAAAFGLSIDEFRRTLGIHGPLYRLPGPVADVEPPRPRWSPRTEAIAALVETLPAAEQDLIEKLCALLHARRGVDLPRSLQGVPR